MPVLNFEPKSEPNKLRCTACGTTTDAPCGCGAPFELLKASARAAIVLNKHANDPKPISNRAAAREAGVSEPTVRKLVREKNALSPSESKEPIWSPERDAKLIQLTEQGKTDRQIAEELNTTEGAISGRRARINLKNFSPTERRLPAVMPDDILLQALEHVRVAKMPLFELDALSTYVDQMHDDTKHRIAEEVEVFYDLSRNIIKRLVGGVRDIKPVACGVELKVRKED